MPIKQHAGWRNLGSRFANRVADVLLDKPKGLYLSSFRCMAALVVRQVTQYNGPYPYIDGLIMQVTRRIDSIEVRHFPRMEGRSNYTLTRLVRLWLNLATSFSLIPLRLAIFAGAVMAALGVIGAVATIIEALFLNQTPTGWASTMVVLLLVGGVQSMILGRVGRVCRPHLPDRQRQAAGGDPPDCPQRRRRAGPDLDCARGRCGLSATDF